MNMLLNRQGASGLSRATIVTKELVEQDTTFFATFIKTENASIIMMSEGKDRLGTLAVAIPQQQKLGGPPLSSILLGDRNMTVARVLAELLAQQTKKIGLASVFIKSVSEQEAVPILRKLLEKTLKNSQE
jgi:hypothetical protein